MQSIATPLGPPRGSAEELDQRQRRTRPLGPEAGGWIRRLSPLWWAHRRVVAIALFASIVSSATLAVTPYLQKIVIDSAILHHTYRIEPLLLLMGVVFALQFVFSGVRRFSAGRVSWDIDYDLRNTVFGHLQGLDFARHDQLQTGQLVSRTNSDLVLIRTLLTQLPLVLANLLQFLLAVVIMIHLSLLLTAVVVPLMPLMFILAFRMRRVVYPSSWEMQARMAEMVGAVDDSVSGVRVVKGFGQEDHELSRVTGRARSSVRLPHAQLAVAVPADLDPADGAPARPGGGAGARRLARLRRTSDRRDAGRLLRLPDPADVAGPSDGGRPGRGPAGPSRAPNACSSSSTRCPTSWRSPTRSSSPTLDGRISFNNVSFGYLRSEPVLARVRSAGRGR